MKPTILIVGDPLDALNYATDSSLAMAEGALGLGFGVHWSTASDLELLNGSVIVKNAMIIEQINNTLPPSVANLAIGHSVPLSAYKKIFVRKDPPFDESYTDLCWFLLQLDDNRVVNAPQALLMQHEKLAPSMLAKAGIIPEYALVPGLVSKNPESLESFALELFSTANSLLSSLQNLPDFKSFIYRVLVKPWRGHGGRGIQTFSSMQEIQNWLSHAEKNPVTGTLKDLFILQPLLPEIFSEGDRRVFVVNGKIAFDFVRKPATGKIEANLAQGGSAELRAMTEEQKRLSEKIALELKRHGILIAGLDFIGDRLTEVNITSPTGIRTFESLTQTPIAKTIMQDLLGE
jgi:glutathione synthase